MSETVYFVTDDARDADFLQGAQSVDCGEKTVHIQVVTASEVLGFLSKKNGNGQHGKPPVVAISEATGSAAQQVVEAVHSAGTSPIWCGPRRQSPVSGCFAVVENVQDLGASIHKLDAGLDWRRSHTGTNGH